MRPRLRAWLLLLLLVLFATPFVWMVNWAVVPFVRELGLVSGWRCMQSPVYTYEPSRERADQTLVAEVPEATVMQRVPGAEIDRVEADLHGGDTLVWSRALGPDGGLDDYRVYVLTPGRLRRTPVCNSQLGDWKIVGEHDLG